MKNDTRNITAEHDDDEMLMIEANIDDCQGEWMGYTMEKLLSNGANDVYFTPIIMKKNRPAYKLSVLAHQSKLSKLSQIIFTETTSFGIRHYPVTCHRIERKFEKVNTPWGDVNIKIGKHLGEIVQLSPEYEDCKNIAQQFNLPLGTIYQTAIEQFQLKYQVPEGK
ncbi:nickel insertion protein [Robertmurraya massiliosenegalensis]|uniref:nickel insertion protein n=1 Tax=Robertmurraya TaxID=2837507 RepID=UPI0039A62B85